MTGLLMKYFVLKPKGNDPYANASRRAMVEYANKILPTNPELANDILEWVEAEDSIANLNLIDPEYCSCPMPRLYRDKEDNLMCGNCDKSWKSHE